MCPSDLTPWPPSLRGKGENLAGLSGQPTSGTQDAGEPSASEGGQMGDPGGKAPWQGVWGMCPQKPKEGASCQPLQPAHEWDPERWRILSQRGRGRGVEGAQPLPRGFGGCAPKIKKRGRVAHISHPATSGTQNAGEPLAANGGGQMGGARGAMPPWRGVWGVSPHENLKRGELPTPATRPRVGPRTLANPQPTRVGNGGGGGATPHRGFGGRAPKNKKEGASSLH